MGINTFIYGNPDVPPPKVIKKIMIDVAQDASHFYTSPVGYKNVRECIANHLNFTDGLNLTYKQIIMTSGAVAGLNVVLRSVVEPDQEILSPSPYFFGIEQIAKSIGAKLTTSQPSEGFHLDLESIKKNITKKTRAVYINTPNNPTGVIYNKVELIKLSSLLMMESERTGHPIYLIVDEVYKEIVYKYINIPSILSLYPYSFVVNSYSKGLSLSGERIGYVAMNSMIDELVLVKIAETIDVLYYNAPAFFQQVVARMLNMRIDVSIYKKRRDLISRKLHDLGYEFDIPDGTFYLFIKSPIRNDLKFVEILKSYGVLVLPGDSFNYPGYFRVSYTVPEQTILDSIEGFKKARMVTQ